jgi:anti-sigma-K factor RskA
MLGENHVTELIPEYSLNALDEEATLEVAQHLGSCDACRQELQAYVQILDDLPFALAETDPPSSIKERLMTRIGQEESSLGHKENIGLWQRITETFKRPVPVWGVVSVAVIVLLSISTIWFARQANEQQNNPAGTMNTVAMLGTENAPQASGWIVVSSDGEYGTLIVENLRALDPSLQYQLWLIQDGVRTSGGVFSVDEHGYVSHEIPAPQHLNLYQAFGITIEPSGGSQQPTGKKVLGSQG